MIEFFNKIIYFSILLRTFNYLNKINYFVQVGSHDGKMHDPLFPLLSKNNWNGVLIEPQKKMIQRFKKRYNERDNLQYFNLAVHPSKTTIKLYSLKNPENYSQTGWSSILPERFSLIKNKNSIDAELVKAKPLMSIIKDSKFRIVDLLQIDTEGYEYNIVKGINSTNLGDIDFIYFEHHYDLMIKKGYKFSEINYLLKKNNFKQKLKLKMKFRKSFEYIYESKKKIIS